MEQYDCRIWIHFHNPDDLVFFRSWAPFLLYRFFRIYTTHNLDVSFFFIFQILSSNAFPNSSNIVDSIFSSIRWEFIAWYQIADGVMKFQWLRKQKKIYLPVLKLWYRITVGQVRHVCSIYAPVLSLFPPKYTLIAILLLLTEPLGLIIFKCRIVLLFLETIIWS